MKKKSTGVLTENDWQRLTSILEEIVEKTKPKWVDSYLTVADKAAGDYKKFDEEKTVMAGQIEDLDNRVRTVEKHLHISP